MAKKLTQQTLERMVMQTMNESKQVNELFGFGSLFGRDKPTVAPSQGRPLSGLPRKSGGKDQSNVDQLLSMIMSDPKVPSYIKDLATDVFSNPDTTPKMSQAQLDATRGQRPVGRQDEIPDEEMPTTQSATSTDWDLEEIPDENVLPNDLSSRTPTTKGIGAPNMNRRPESVYSSPQATSGPSKAFSKKGFAPHLDFDFDEEEDTSSTAKEPTKKFAESKRIEAMVMEAMEEMNMSYVGSAGDRRGKTPLQQFGKKPSKSEAPTTKKKTIPTSPKLSTVPTVKEDPSTNPTAKMTAKMPTRSLKKGVAESNQFESLIADVLKEMAKKPVKK